MLGSLPVGRPSADANRPEAEPKGGSDVHVKAVADHNGFFRFAAERVQGLAKDAPIGFGYAYFAGEEDRPEVVFEAVLLEPQAGGGLGVAYQREWTTGGQSSQGGVGIRGWSKQATAPRIDVIPEPSCDGTVGPHKLQSPRPDVRCPFFHRLPQRAAEGSRAHPPAIGVKSGDSESDPSLSGRQLVQKDAAEIDEAAAEGWKTERSHITLIRTAREHSAATAAGSVVSLFNRGALVQGRS